MYTHTFKITLSNGTKGEISLSMPSMPDEALWMDRGAQPDPLGQVNELAVRTWVIAAQADGRKATDIEAAQARAEAYKFGERASPVQKPVTVSADLDWTEEQLAEMTAQGITLN